MKQKITNSSKYFKYTSLYYFLGVNYKTSQILERWIVSLANKVSSAHVIIIDNYSTDHEREMVTVISQKFGATLIKSPNCGYSHALNLGLAHISTLPGGVVFCGNVDIDFLAIPKNLPVGKFCYVPVIKEGKRQNRNPFLKSSQLKLIPLYTIAAVLDSIVLYYFAVTINKFVGFFPSKTWTIHGSLFCFHTDVLKSPQGLPFNSKSFLYGEELEFGKFCEICKIKFIDSDIAVFHTRNVSTKNLITNQRRYIVVWAQSFRNFKKRWF